MKRFAFAWVLLTISLQFRAQVPQQVNYQGLARNASGLPLANQSIQIRLSIRDSISSGTILYSETRPVATNQFGIFAIAVNSPGASNTTGNFSTINWAKNNKYLQVEIDPAGGTSFVNLGSTQLLSVPFALYAGNGITIPFSVTQSLSASPLISLTNSSTTGTEGAIQLSGASNDSNAAIMRSVLSSASPGTFSSAIRGMANSTGNNGIGVWGSHNGSGSGVYGTTVGGVGITGNASAGGTGVQGMSSTGNSGSFINTNAANSNATLLVTSNGTGPSFSTIQTGTGRASLFQINNAANSSHAADLSTNGSGNTINAVSTGTGMVGFFQINNATSTKNAVQITSNATEGSFNSVNTGKGEAGIFQINNATNTSTAIDLSTTGLGSGITIRLTNAGNGARGIDILQAGVGPGVFSSSAGGNAVWGITSSISAAGVIGDNTFGEAVVGRNRGGNGVGAVVGRNDSAGYGVRGFNTKTGIGVLGQSGISGGTGKAGRFENVNAANTTNVFEVASNSNANLAVFIKTTNVARIDATGKGFFNGGTQAGGADVAEAFDVTGEASEYEPGDVLIISATKDRTVEKSYQPYSTLVAGVYATKPGVLLTEEHIDVRLDHKVPMGVLGVLPTKVCNEGGPIKRGDILVSSSLAGVAMKADPEKLKPGQMIGKALEEFDSAITGKINVLVTIR
jgi:hypothetical protein